MYPFPYAPENYNQQLNDKIAQLREDFSGLQLPEIAVFESPRSHYRMRAEFRVWHKNDRVELVMFGGDTQQPQPVTEFPIGSERINQLILQLLNALNGSSLLRRKLYQVEFLTTLSGEALITLIYHRPLDDDWEMEAEALRQQLNFFLVGRSRKQKRVLGRDYVLEELRVGEETFCYQQVEGGFTQPNAAVCEKMLSWAVEKTRGSQGDLVELYCGNGNFTLPLSRNFRKVLATEVSTSSVNSAQFNLTCNKIENVTIARLAAEEFVQALDRVRPFFRLRHIDLDEYAFSSIFVDPPRAGLDENTLRLCQRFEQVIYVSCNPQTLRANLEVLSQSHRMVDFAVFDQFPYTHHLECGVVLKRNS